MRVLNLSLDKTILEKDSATQKRLLALAEAAGSITVLVPASKTEHITLSPHVTVYSFGGPKVLQFFRMWKTAIQLTTNHQPPTTHFELITVQDPYFLGFLGAQLAKKFSLPLEVQVHGLEKFSGVRKWIARFVLGKAKKIRVVSNRLRYTLAKSYKLKANSLYVLPVYTQIESLIHNPLSLTKKKGKAIPYPFTFLTVGRLVPVKNIAMQIRALAKVAERIPHVKLQIVGDGPELARLLLEARTLNLEASVVFEGYQKDPQKYYEEADAFLLTSDSEGWGRVVLEAAAHRLPIIMTDVGLAQEVIKNNESGFIIPVGDEHELILAMQELIGNPELRARLGEGALKAFKALPKGEEQIRQQVTEWSSLR